MYGDVYEYQTKPLSNETYVYSNGVSYLDGTYTLTGATTSGAWSSIYSGLSNTHYTCFNNSTTCTSVNYIYNTTSSRVFYITLNGEKDIEVALSNMLDKNDTSSKIKGDATTSGTLDYWYANNITGTNYESYIEDTVWCNDRSISSLGGWNPNGGTTSSNYELYFGAYNRSTTTYIPDLTCTREIDRFTKDTKNGNGDLDYPVGLITMDEGILAGGKYQTSNSSYYLYTGKYYWAESSFEFVGGLAYSSIVNADGNVNGGLVDSNLGVRPSISLKSGFTIVDNNADGSVNKPYIVE